MQRRDIAKRDEATKMGWNINDIDFVSARKQGGDDELLFYLLASASFVEHAADAYTANLITRFGEKDAALHDWLKDVWKTEECRHGEVLRRYVAVLWPEFNWQEAYDSFLQEYLRAATDAALNASDALEMLERCIVETGTSSLYAMLESYAQDPLLKTICRRIRNDELRHYKQFLHYYEYFNRDEKRSRIRVFMTLMTRATEMQREDSRTAFRHIYRTANGNEAQEGVYDVYVKRVGAQVVCPHFPYKMAVGLATQPLRLPGSMQKGVAAFVDALARRFFFAA